MQSCIHIGLPKAASTAIQRALGSLREPHAWADVGSQAFGNHRIVSAVLGDQSPSWIERTTLDELQHQVKSLKSDHYHHVSSEAFSYYPFLTQGGPECLKQLFNPDCIIVCLRDQASVLNASYMQNLKHGAFNGQPAEFLSGYANSKFSILDIVNSYDAIAPVHIIDFSADNVLTDYRSLTGCDFDIPEESKADRYNVSVSYLAAAAVNRLIYPAKPADDGGWETNELIALAGDMFPGSKLGFDDATIEQIRSLHSEDNRALLDRFGIDLDSQMGELIGQHALPSDDEISAAARDLVVRINRDRTHFLHRLRKQT
ncbi:MAG: hypothetical protein AAF739_17240 [Pseudomonadota bacterium]